MRVVSFPAPSGSAYWRLIDPFKYLRKKGIEAIVSNEGITEELARWGDIFVLENCVDKEGIALLYAYQQEFGKKIVVDQDDYIWVNDDNPYKRDHEITNAPEVVKKTLQVADLITTTNDYLADKLKEFNPNIAVLPNYMDLERWNQPKKKNKSNSIKIGWAGSLTHMDDLKSIVNPIKRICQEFDNVKLFFVGETRAAELFDGCNVEAMRGVDFDAWPSKLNGLGWDIALAPLKDSVFNRCKSKIKFYEYGIAEIPGVYSTVVYGTRGFDGQFGMTAENEEQWYRNIKNYIIAPELRKDIARAGYQHVVERCSLEKHINEWVKAYESLTSDP